MQVGQRDLKRQRVEAELDEQRVYEAEVCAAVAGPATQLGD